MLTDKLKVYHPNTTVHQMMFKKLMFLMSLYSLISWRKRKNIFCFLRMSIWKNRVWPVRDRPCETQTKKYELLCTWGT